MNKRLQGAHVHESMSKGKTIFIQKKNWAKNISKQIQTHNLPTDDVENINSTSKGEIYYSLTSRG